MFLPNGLSTCFINSKRVFTNGPGSLPINSPSGALLDIWIFGNVILADEAFAKALKTLKTCVLVTNNLCGKLVS